MANCALIILLTLALDNINDLDETTLFQLRHLREWSVEVCRSSIGRNHCAAENVVDQRQSRVIELMFASEEMTKAIQFLDTKRVCLWNSVTLTLNRLIADCSVKRGLLLNWDVRGLKAETLCVLKDLSEI